MKTLPALSIITRSEAMRRILGRLDTISASDGSVLLVGETGSGKELFADYIHRTSPRSAHAFIKIALSAMPHELLESELFGHEKGSFTHALHEKRGLFELAHGGSLFLDDIDDVPAGTQTKLLRVLESREVKRVGGTRTIPVDVRLISASKVDLKELAQRGIFRADLLYRINVVPVEIPPLRERREDVPLLFDHFFRRFAPGRAIALSPEAEDALTAYGWPGNVRELRNIAQRIALFAEGTVARADLPEEFQDHHPVQQLLKACTRCLVEESMPLAQVVACLERNLLVQALQQSDGNQTRAARALGLSLSTLRDKMKKYGLEATPAA